MLGFELVHPCCLCETGCVAIVDDVVCMSCALGVVILVPESGVGCLGTCRTEGVL